MLPLLILLIIIPHPVRGYGHRDGLYMIFTSRSTSLVERNRCVREVVADTWSTQGSTALDLDSEKVSVLFCLVPCSESITVFFVLWLHFAGTCICTILCFAWLFVCSSLIHFKATFLPHTPEYLLNSFIYHQRVIFRY